MCAGALLQGRVHRIVYGARNRLLGAHGSWVDILSPDALQRGCGQPDADDLGSAATASGWKAVSGGISSTAARKHPFHHGLEVQFLPEAQVHEHTAYVGTECPSVSALLCS